MTPTMAQGIIATMEDRAQYILTKVLAALRSNKQCKIHGAFVFCSDPEASIGSAAVARLLVANPTGGRHDMPGLILIWGSALINVDVGNIRMSHLKQQINRYFDDGSTYFAGYAPYDVLQASALVHGVQWSKQYDLSDVTVARAEISTINSTAHKAGKLPVYPRSLVKASGHEDWVFLTHGGTIAEDA